MRKLFFSLFLFFSILVIKSQDIKFFSGEFAGEIGLGKASYAYFVDKDGNEVRHGNYKFVETHTNPDRGSYTGTLTGTFMNGLKHGVWSYSRILIDALSGNVYVTSTTNVRMNYNNGVPEGDWSYTSSGKYRARLYSLAGWRWGNYQSQKPVAIQFSWKNGTIAGNMSYKTPFVQTVGQLDTNGKWIGKWVVDGQEFILDDGIVITGIKDVNGRYEDQELINLRKQYKSLSIADREAFSTKHRLMVDTVRGINHYNINDGYFNDRVFNCNEPYGKYEKSDQINYGYYVVIKRARIIPLKELLQNVNLNFQTAEELEKRLENNKINLTNEDIETFKKLIEDTRVKRELEAEEKKYKQSFDRLYAQLSKLTEIEKEKCVSSLNPSMHGRDYMERLMAIDGYISVIKKIDWRTKYFSNNSYTIRDFSSTGYKSFSGEKNVLKTGNNKSESVLSIKESYEKLNDYMQFVKSKQEGKDVVGRLYCLTEEIRTNAYEVEKTYVNYSGSGNVYTETKRKVNKPKLYTRYKDTFGYFFEKINKDDSIEEIYQSLQDINNLCLFMLDKVKEKTKDIEKELNSTNKVEEWGVIFKKYISR